MTKQYDNLAIFGGEPLFGESNKKYVGKPVVLDIDRVLLKTRKALEQGQLTNNGPNVQKLEKKICSVVDCNHTILLGNATLALMLAFDLLDRTKDKKEIIVPSFTFIASVSSIVYSGFKPVLCDINIDSCQMDPKKLGELISDKTAGVLFVNAYGHIGQDMLEVSNICKEKNIPLIIDAAQSFGSVLKNDMGNTIPLTQLSDLVIYSFHATKIINTYEGGAITTNNDVYAKKLSMQRNFGYFEGKVKDIGINAKMNEISAIQGLVQLKHLQDIIDHNKKNFLVYQSTLADLENCKIVPTPPSSNHSYVTIRVLNEKFRNKLVEIMEKEGAYLRKYFEPAHEIETVRKKCTFEDLRNTDILGKQVLCLPTGLDVSETDSKLIAECLKVCFESEEQLRK